VATQVCLKKALEEKIKNIKVPAGELNVKSLGKGTVIQRINNG
jgi:hypothetical protein